MHPRHYNVRVAKDIGCLLVLPSLALFATLHFWRIQLHSLAWICYPVFTIFWGIGRGAVAAITQARERRALNARAIPCVIGKWPGNVDILLRMMKAFKDSYILEVYLELFKEYRCTTLNLRVLWRDTIITMDHEHVKFVTSTGFDHFSRGVAQKERMETFLGEGIFNRDDDIWKMHRNMARPFFARERISDFETFERNTARTISIISADVAAGKAIEMQDLVSRFTLDAASEFLFGRNMDTLSMALPLPGGPMGPRGSMTNDAWGSFTKAFEMAQQVATQRGRIGYFWPLFELGGDKNAPHVDVIHKWMHPVVQQALEDKARAHQKGVEHDMKEKNFLQHLADSTDDPIIIRDQLLSMLLASRDTTACLLTFVTYFMALYPDVTRKLREEVLETCGPSAAPTYEHIRKMKYMRAVINETLRLFPPVPLNVRESRSLSFTLPLSDPSFPVADDSKTLYMPGNTLCMIFPLLIQRNPVLWGPDADEFDPERWLDKARLARFLANPTMYTPFSAGPRICVGQNYALNEASYFLTRLLQNFDTFTLAPELQPAGSLPPHVWKRRPGRQATERVWPAAALTLFVKGGLWVRLGRSQQ